MDEQLKAKHDLDFIKQMMQVQRRNSASTASPYFIIWGAVWIIGFGTEAIGLTSILHFVWGGFSILAMTLTILLNIKQAKTDPLPKVFDQKLGLLLSTFSIIVILFAVLILTDHLQFGAHLVGLYSVILVSILYLLLGVVLGKEIFVMGIWFALLAIFNALVFPPYHAGLMAIVGGGSFFLTGLILRKWRKSNGSTLP